MNRAYLGYIYYIYLNYKYFWRVYELNEYLAKIYIYSLLRLLRQVYSRQLKSIKASRIRQKEIMLAFIA